MFPFSSLSILKAVVFKSLFSTPDVSLGTVSGDVFCSFEMGCVFLFIVCLLIFGEIFNF